VNPLDTTEQLTVVVCAPILGRDLGPIRSISPTLNVIDANAAFEDWRAARRAADQQMLTDATKRLSESLAEADVLCMMYPMLEEVVTLAPRLRWLHHTQAGVSNLWSSDVWTARHVLITSGRGHVRPTAIAEYCLAAASGFARGLHDGYLDRHRGRLDLTHYRPLRIAGATMGVVGLGGIGKEVARLSQALGMRVVATRRSAVAVFQNVDHADLIVPPAQMGRLAAESDFIAVCTALTHETQRLLNAEFFAQTAKEPLLVNISRGEVVDETAMLDALDGGRLRGAVLDVYDGELERKPPRPELLSHPNIVLTPHVSGLGAAEDGSFMALFCENLQRYLNGEELLNVVDRDRGY
jgi:phosphoglycerate dehydrogenase-like enzyme